jgi:hypothetical protein
MRPSSSPTFLEICNALRTKRGFAFEEICNDYLKARFPNLVPWISTNVESTIPGTPDAFLLDESGNLIACQYGSGSKGWQTKLLGNEHETGDAEKVAQLATRYRLNVKKLIFCTTAQIDVWDLNSIQTEAESKCGFAVEICDLGRIGSDIEKLYPGIAFRRLGLPIRLQHFITVDDYLRSTNPRYWPKLTDVEDGKLFHPSQYITEIHEILRREKRCLLTGKSGAGKSVLSIEYALWRRDNRKNQTIHPEAVVFYLDVASTYSAESGEDWYRQLIHHDYQNELFILDNCHLAPEAVNAFCFQWERRRPEQTHVLLISRVTEPPMGEDSEYYFENFESSQAIVEVCAEDSYLGVLRTYSDIYCKAEPSRFVSLDLDLRDLDRAEKLERECSHNLAGARGRLEAWYENGGKLSDIGVEQTYKFLAERHLTRAKRPVIVSLCSLTAFEIPIHESYLEQLPVDSVDTAFRENLLLLNDTLRYGHCYQLAFHPEVAAQLFDAYIKQRYGSTYKDKLLNETVVSLKKYLSVSPPNFVEVYRRLSRSGRVDLRDILLGDPEMQERGESQLGYVSLDDSLWYLQSLFRRTPETARTLLHNLLSELSAEQLRAKIFSLTAEQVKVVAWTLLTLDIDIAKSVFDKPSPQIVGHILKGKNVKLVLSILEDLQKFDLQEDFFNRVGEILDREELASQIARTSARTLHVKMRTLKSCGPDMTALIEKYLKPEEIIKAFTDRGKIMRLENLLGEFSKEFGKRVLQHGNIEVLASILGRSPLRETASFLEHRLYLVKSAYELFVSQFLSEKYVSETLREISLFITRIQRCGDADAVKMSVETLLSSDISSAIAKGDTVGLAFLLEALSRIDVDFERRFLEQITPEIFDLALENTDIEGLQRLIARAKSLPPILLTSLEAALQKPDYVMQVPNTNFNDLSYLVWNIRIAFGEDLARHYSRIVDDNIQDRQIIDHSIEDVRRILWTIVQISGRGDLNCLSNPVLLQRVNKEALSDPVNCVQIFAIMLLANRSTGIDAQLFDPTKTFTALIPSLRQCVKDKRANLFALTIEGLRATDPPNADLLIRKALRKNQLRRDCLSLLEHASETAITPLSIELLNKTRTYVEQLAYQ